MTMAQETQGFLAIDEGRSFRLGPLTVLVKEDGSGTRGSISVAEFRGEAFRIPPHTHTEHDETIYVLEGTLGVMLGDKTVDLVAGGSFTIPVNVVHSVSNESGAQVRFLNVIAPARYLSYFDEMAAAAGAGLPTPEVMGQIMRKYGLQPVAQH